jgi:hypothetical protein
MPGFRTRRVAPNAQFAPGIGAETVDHRLLESLRMKIKLLLVGVLGLFIATGCGAGAYSNDEPTTPSNNDDWAQQQQAQQQQQAAIQQMIDTQNMVNNQAQQDAIQQMVNQQMQQSVQP